MQLIEGAQALRRPTALEEALRTISIASPRTKLFACIYRSHPALEIGVCAAIRDGRRLDLEGLPEAFAKSPTFFDRWSVEADQRDRWRSYSDMGGAQPLGKYWRARDRSSPQIFRRILLCQGPRPLAYVSASLLEGEQPWSAGELHALDTAYRRVSAAVRLTALAWRDRQGGPDVSERLGQGDEVLCLSPDGIVLASSPTARRWLREDRELDGLVRSYGEGAAGRSYRMRHFQLRTEKLEGHQGAQWQLLRCRLIREMPAPHPAEVWTELSPREAELAEWLVEGLTNAEIAERMRCRPSTVKTMLERLYDKHEVRGRVELTRFLLSARA